MSRARIDGIPILRFTRRVSARHWNVVTALVDDSPTRRWSVTLSPRRSSSDDNRVPFARVQIERADGTIEGKWSPDPSSANLWTYTRTIDLRPGEAPPSVVLHELILPRVVYVRRQLRIAPA